MFRFSDSSLSYLSSYALISFIVIFVLSVVSSLCSRFFLSFRKTLNILKSFVWGVEGVSCSRYCGPGSAAAGGWGHAVTRLGKAEVGRLVFPSITYALAAQIFTGFFTVRAKACILPMSWDINVLSLPRQKQLCFQSVAMVMNA